MAITLNVDKVLRAAQRAKDEGRLAAFKKASQDCKYRYLGKPEQCCAIGAGMSDKQAAKLTPVENSLDVGDLVSKGVFKITAKDLPVLVKLQELHDYACNGDTKLRGSRRAAFTRYLNKQIAALPPEVPAA